MNDLQFIKSAENTLLSSFFANYELLENSNFKDSFFYFSENKNIFLAMKNLLKKELPFDEDFLVKELKNKENFRTKFIEIITTNPVTNTNQIENELIEQYKKRELEKLLKHTINEIDDNSTDSILNKLSNIDFVTADGTWNFSDIQNIIPEKPKFYLENILPIQFKEINLITSQGGKGKSFTALYLMGELAKLDLKVFGWLSEDSEANSKNRFNTICYKNKHLTNANFKIFGKEKRLQSFIKVDKSGNYEASDFFLTFKKNMREFDIIVIDPLVSLLCKDENNNIEARFLMNLINEWIEKDNKTLILIHHSGKDENSKSRGASAIVDSVRIHYSLSSVENLSTHRKLNLEKSNHFAGAKNEFLIHLFKNEIKPFETVFENKKEEIFNENIETTFDMGGIEILNDVVDKKESELLKNKMKNKGVLFDD